MLPASIFSATHRSSRKLSIYSARFFLEMIAVSSPRNTRVGQIPLLYFPRRLSFRKLVCTSPAGMEKEKIPSFSTEKLSITNFPPRSFTQKWGQMPVMMIMLKIFTTISRRRSTSRNEKERVKYHHFRAIPC